MDFIIFLFVALMCFNVAVKIFNSEERNKVFNKRPIEVEDVKKYNRFCGTLVIVFCVAVEHPGHHGCADRGSLSGYGGLQ